MCKACRIYRAEAELAAGNLRKAMFEARRARELQPDYDLAGFAEALTLIHLEQLEKASEILKKLRSRDRQSQAPSVELVQAMQGIVAHHLGKEKNAQQLLEGVARRRVERRLHRERLHALSAGRGPVRHEHQQQHHLGAPRVRARGERARAAAAEQPNM